MARTMQGEEVHQGPPMQLNFGGLGGRITTGSATPIKQKPREVAPARLPSPYGGPKSCTQCGTTRTPQWREGPCGPKTLCNACGVKLVRKNRGVAEAKRRAAIPAGSADKAAAVAAHLFLDRHSPSPEPWSNGADSGADETPLAVESAAVPAAASPRVYEPSPLGVQQQSRRPVRRAAVKAASRTAEYASTGDWPADEGVVPALGDAQSDASVENSDSAEEVAWAPRQLSDGDAAFAASLPRNMPQETSAAINLMAMSYKGEKGSRGALPSSPHAQLLAVPQTDASVPFQDPQASTPRGNLRLSYLRANSRLSSQEQAVEEFLRSNAPARFVQYEALQQTADSGWKQTADAELCVGAVARYLAQKQAEAIRAREAARAATQQLHSFLQDADAELDVSRKRQRI